MATRGLGDFEFCSDCGEKSFGNSRVAQFRGVQSINADEPVIIDYNTDFKTQDLYTSGPYRASDHDPVVIGLNLQATTVKAAAPKTIAKSAVGK